DEEPDEGDDEPEPGEDEDEGEEGDEEDEDNDDDEGDEDEGDEEEGDEGPEMPTPDNEDLKKYLLNEPGTVIDYDANLESVKYVFGKWKNDSTSGDEIEDTVFRIEDEIRDGDKIIGSQVIHVSTDGRFRVDLQMQGQKPQQFLFDGEQFWTVGENTDAELSIIRAKINPVVTQGLALLACVQETPFGVFGKPILDGGDKAVEQLSSRIMMLDDDDDWFYYWLSLYDDSGHEQTRLLKISSDRDCGRRSRGMTFEDYKDVDGVAVPFLKTLVSGLNEKVHWVAVTQTFERVSDPDSGLFVARKDTGE
ncbi:MAG: hypothetical protein ACR2NP_08120, partial [Pirellulaceae bacterium]